MNSFNDEDELAFLQTVSHAEQDGNGDFLHHQLATSPLLTRSALRHRPGDFPSRGLLGIRGGDSERVYFNTNAPNSTVICGVQGSGKSHTLSCLLECGLISDTRIGRLPNPLSALVFHFDTQDLGRPCEAAFIASEAAHSINPAILPQITVLCSPGNFERRRRAYSSLTDVRVYPLQLSEKDLTADRMLAIMGCNNLETAPLYLHTVLRIIREMAGGGNDFSYLEFKRRIAQEVLDAKQKSMLKLRLDLLDYFIRPNAPAIHTYFHEAGLVLIDLTDPFLDGLTAAVLFDSVLASFIQWQTACGKLVVLDEAHKYLANNDSDRLTQSVGNVIRLQRHLATRVIIATQEPTVIPATILDLASIIVCHRFSSPAWCAHLARHVSTGNESARWFEEVMLLPTGQAIVFCSSALIAAGENGPHLLGREHVKLRVRPRLTLDGGASRLAAKFVPSSPDSQPVGGVDATVPPLTVPSTFVPPAAQQQDSVPNTPVSPWVERALPSVSLDTSATSVVGNPGWGPSALSLEVSNTLTSLTVPARLEKLLEWLSSNGAAQAPVKLGLAVNAIFGAVREAYPGTTQSGSWNAMLQEAVDANLIGLVNMSLPLTNKQLRQCGKIRLLQLGPFVYV